MRALLVMLVVAVLASGVVVALVLGAFPEPFPAEPPRVSCTAATGCAAPDLDIPRDHIDYYDSPNE